MPWIIIKAIMLAVYLGVCGIFMCTVKSEEDLNNHPLTIFVVWGILVICLVGMALQYTYKPLRYVTQFAMANSRRKRRKMNKQEEEIAVA